MNKPSKLLLAILLVVIIVSGWVVKTSTKNIKLNDIAKTKDESQETKIKEAYLKLPIHFEENLGQVNDQVSFVHKSQGKPLFLTADEAVFSLAGEKDKPSSAIRMKVKGANKSAKAKSEDKLQSYSNYFIGNDQSKWRTNVAHYGKVRYSDVYKGIDLVYHGNNQILEYDFEVSPQVDPKQIAIEFQGIEKLEIEPNGDLSIKTSNGTLSNHKPIIYQEIDGQKQVIAGNFKLLSNDSVGFEVGDYNPNLPLIIDPPISLTYSTYLGGTGFELGNAIAIDSSGNAYVTGQTFSTNFPTMGAFQSTLVGSSDAFVTKLSPTGSGVYSTYLGGNSGDTGIAIAVDASGNAYITGVTASTSFPLMTAFQSTFGGGSADAFVTKLAPTGNSLIYSTYLGSSVQDQGLAIAVDSSGNAYIAGEVRSTTGPISSTNFPTMNAFQSTFGGGNADAFVTKFSSTGNNLVYSTLLGGNNDDQGAGIAVDTSGNAYVTGETFSTNFPTMNAFQSTNAGNADAFVTKLSAMGSSLVYSTYLGGSSSESGSEIAVDAGSNAYITGQTFSTNFPTMNAFQSTFGGGNADAFITKLSSTGNNIVYSTYLGGSNDDQGAGIAVDSSGNTYITGNTNSTNFPTMNAFQSSLSGTPDLDRGSPTDVFVTQLSATGSSLLNSTYLGGNSNDRGSGIAVDASGNAYVIGQANSTDFPTTMGAFQSTGGGDAFVTKLILVTTTPTTTTVTSSPNLSVFGQAVTLTATVTQQSGTTTPTGMVEFFDGSTSLGTATLNASSQASIMTSAIQAGSRSITAMYAGDSNYSASTSAAITQTVNKANTTTAVVSNANPSVFGQSVTFTATVSAVAPGSGTATGMVQFIDGTTNLDSPVSLISGQAQLSISNLSVATHSITAMYLGDSNFNASTSTAINQVVNKANTSSVVTSSLNPSNFNQLVTFTATVRADTPGLPTGIVQFKDGANNLGNPVSLDGKGKAQLSTSTLTGGSHSITVVYNGDTSFNASTSVIFTQTVNPVASTTTLTVTPTTSVFGQAVSLSATVTGVGGTPTGTIQFKDGVTNLGSPVTLVSGSASVQVSTLTTGSHSLTAVYSGDNNFNPSTSAAITQTVNRANTTTAVVSNANPSVFGQTVTFTATVSAVAPGSGTATGMVQFIDGSTNLGSPVSLTSGQAQLSISNLSVATHSITAMYLGDSNFNVSTSTAINQVVNKANTSTALTANPSQIIFGQTVTLTATVTANAPGAGVPGGSVQFNNGANSLGTATLDASGVASLNIALTTAGFNTITAVYSGNTSFNTSISNSATVFVASVDHNTIYVADTLNNRIQRSTNNGTTWQLIGNGVGLGLGQFNAPKAVAVNFSDTVIFVADTGNNRIQRSTNGGVSWTVMATAGTATNQVNRPDGLAYDEVSNQLYIADTMNNRILVVNAASTATPVFAIFAGATAGTAIGKFNQPKTIAVNTTGAVYVTDTANNRIQVNSNGLSTGWTVLASTGRGLGQVNMPKGVYVDNTGRIWVADTGNNRIQVNINGVWSVFMSAGTGVGRVNSPEGVVVNLSGNVFIADTANNRTQSKPASGGNAIVVGQPGLNVAQFNQPSGIR